MKKYKFILYVIGILLVSCGIAALTVSRLGLASIDAICVNFSVLTKLSVGTSVIIVNVIIILVSTAIHPNIRNLLSIIVSLFLGTMIDIFISIFENIPHDLMFVSLEVLIGIVFIPIGAALTIYSNYPTLAGEVMMKSINGRFKVNATKSKFYTELIYLITAIILGLMANNLRNTISILTLVLFITSSIILPFVLNRLNGGKNA